MLDTKAHGILLGGIVALAALTFSSARLEGILHHATLYSAMLTAVNIALYQHVAQPSNEK